MLYARITDHLATHPYRYGARRCVGQYEVVRLVRARAGGENGGAAVQGDCGGVQDREIAMNSSGADGRRTCMNVFYYRARRENVNST